MRDQSLILEGGGRWPVGEKRGRLQLLRHPHRSFHAVLPLARKFLCKKKKYLPGNGKEFCFQQGNKDITLFLINPKIIAIPKQIRVRKCQKSKSY